MNKNFGKIEDVENIVKTENVEEALEDGLNENIVKSENVKDLVNYENIEEALEDGMNDIIVKFGGIEVQLKLCKLGKYWEAK